MNVVINLSVNGTQHALTVRAEQLLLDVLRNQLNLTGTKESCSMGVCGACTVLVDGRLSSACLELAARCDGAEITTVEGVASGAELDPVQRAFIECGGFQCGICTPGMVITTKALLAENPDPTDQDIRHWMAGSLCRCTGYYKIFESVQRAAELLRSESGA